MVSWAGDNKSFLIDANPPVIENLLPLDNFRTTISLINFSANVSDGVGLKNATLNIFNSTSNERVDFNLQDVLVGDVGTVSATQNYGGCYLEAYGYEYIFHVYAYKDIDGVRVYSENPQEIYFYDDYSYSPMYITLDWDDVSGAEGYRIFIVKDDYTGIVSDYYYIGQEEGYWYYLDTGDSYYDYNGGCDSISWEEFQAGIVPESSYQIDSGSNIHYFYDSENNAELNMSADLDDGLYYWYLDVYDVAGNLKTSEERSFTLDTTPPTITNITNISSIYSQRDLDPRINISINASVVDAFLEVDSVILQFYNGSWNNYTMSPDGTIYSANVSLNYNDYSNYTYNIWTNDTLGNLNTSINYQFYATWDCTWNITTTDLSAIGFDTTKNLGNITVINDGDDEYDDGDGCFIDFGIEYNTSSLQEFSFGHIINLFNFYPLKFNSSSNNGITPYSFSIGPKSNESISIWAIFPRGTSPLGGNEIPYVENPVLKLSSNIIDTIYNRSREIFSVEVIVAQPGAYLRTPVFENQTSTIVYLKEQNLSLISYTENIGGDGSANYTAYNVSLNFTIPNFLNYSNETNISSFFENISTSGIYYYNNISLIFNNETLRTAENGQYEVCSYTWGYENTSGNLSLINHAGNVEYLSSCYNVTFSCYETRDYIDVPACWPNDPDSVYCGNGYIDFGETCSSCAQDVGYCPTTPSSSSGGGGGGGGGASGGSFAKSEATFELVRGEAQEFYLEVDNKLSSPKKDITVKISGDNSEYFSIPSSIDYIAPNSKEELNVKITAPSYFPAGKYLIKFEFTGTIAGNTSSPFTETKFVTLTILEISRPKATELLDASIDYVSQMNESGLIVKDVNLLLQQINDNYNSSDFGKVRDLSKALEDIYNSAIESNKTITELRSLIEEAEKNGIQVSETKKLLYLAEILFKRGDYLLALEKLKESKLTYSLETKGEFKILYAIKNNPLEALGILISLSLVGTGSGLWVRLRLLKRKMKVLAEEEQLLLQLMKVVQRDCFENNKMSMEEYDQAMMQYEKRLGEVIRDRIRTETLISNLMKLKGKKSALQQERDRLQVLLRNTQDDYMNKGKLDTRVYENMLRAYGGRLSQIQEELVYMEAREELKRFTGIRFWKKSR